MLDRLRRDAALTAIDQWGFFHSVRWVDQVDSTNRQLARELKSDASPSLPALLVADRQAAGVGRGANAWWSPDGCLMFSMAIPWPDAHRELAKLPLRVGLAVAHALAPWSRSSPKVKWPNDVYIENRKVCGILIESSRERGDEARGDVTIIGIGINCRVDLDAAPHEVRSNAISLHEVARDRNGESTTTEAVLVSVVQHWLQAEQRSIDDPYWMNREWPEWCWLDGKWVEVTSAGSSLAGRALGIDAQGALIVEDRWGRTHAILSGTVRPMEIDR